MDYEFIFAKATDHTGNGKSADEAFRLVLDGEENRKYSPDKAVEMINEKLQDEGVQITKITDPDVVAHRKELREKAERINNERAYDLLSFSTWDVRKKSRIDRAAQNYIMPSTMEGAEEFNRRLCNDLDINKNGEEAKKAAERFCTEVLLEYNHIDYTDMFKERSDEELVDYYSQPENIWHLRIIMESQNKLEDQLGITLNKDILKLRENVGSRYMGWATYIQKRITQISQKEYDNYDMTNAGIIDFAGEGDEIFPSETIDAEKHDVPKPNYEYEMLRNCFQYKQFGLGQVLQDTGRVLTGNKDVRFAKFPDGEDAGEPINAVEEIMKGKPLILKDPENLGKTRVFSLSADNKIVIIETEYKIKPGTEAIAEPPKKPFLGGFFNAIAGIFGGEYKPYKKYLEDTAEYEAQQNFLKDVKENSKAPQELDKIKQSLEGDDIRIDRAREKEICRSVGLDENSVDRKEQKRFEAGIDSRNTGSKDIDFDAPDIGDKLEFKASDVEKVFDDDNDLELEADTEKMIRQMEFSEEIVIGEEGNQVYKTEKREDYTLEEYNAMKYFDECGKLVEHDLNVRDSLVAKMKNKDADINVAMEESDYRKLSIATQAAYQNVRKYIEAGQSFVHTEDNDMDMSSRLQGCISTIAAYNMIMNERVANNPGYPGGDKNDITIIKKGPNERVLNQMGVQDFINKLKKSGPLKEFQDCKPSDLVEFAKNKRDRKMPKEIAERARELKNKQNKAKDKTKALNKEKKAENLEKKPENLEKKPKNLEKKPEAGAMSI